MNIFVGNLPATATAEGLRRLFAGYGTTLNAIIRHDPDSGRLLGYGHVYVVPDKSAREAIHNLRHARLDGNLLSVRECVYRSRPERRLISVLWPGHERRTESERRLKDPNQNVPATFQQRTG